MLTDHTFDTLEELQTALDAYLTYYNLQMQTEMCQLRAEMNDLRSEIGQLGVHMRNWALLAVALVSGVVAILQLLLQ